MDSTVQELSQLVDLGLLLCHLTFSVDSLTLSQFHLVLELVDDDLVLLNDMALLGNEVVTLEQRLFLVLVVLDQLRMLLIVLRFGLDEKLL